MADANDFGPPGTSRQQQRDSRPADRPSSHGTAVPDEMVSNSNPENLTDNTVESDESDDPRNTFEDFFALSPSEDHPEHEQYFTKVFSGIITPNGCHSRVFSNSGSQRSTGGMKRSQPTSSNRRKRRKPSDGHRAEARNSPPTTAAAPTQGSSAETQLDILEFLGLRSTNNEEWYDSRDGCPPYTSIWTPD